MEKRVLIDTWQKVTKDDFLKFGTFPQMSFDTIVGDVLIPDRAFSGFAVVQSGPAEVTVGAGNLFANGAVYFNDSEGGTTIDLLTRLPVTTKRIVAITVWGQEIDSRLEPRTFLTDADTRATVARDVATEKWRWANVAPVSGVENPDPQAPAVASDVLVVAWVTLATTGVVSIERADDNLVPTLRAATNRLNAIDIWRTAVGTKLDTLTSDLIALAARILGLTPFDFVRRLTADVARLKEAAHLPAAYTAWASDHFLTEDGSDPTHVDWLALIEEGVRFPAAAIEDDQIGLLNPFDASVISSTDFLLPKWTPALRVVANGWDESLSISQYTYQNVDMVQKHMSRIVTRYGTPFVLCTNQGWWQTGQWDPWSGTFTRDNGDVFQVSSILETGEAGQGNQVDEWWNPGNYHLGVRMQQVWQDSVDEAYWDKIVTNFTISGSMLAQTFLNSQDGWLCQLNLYFGQRGSTGDVNVIIAETTNGMPDLSKIIAKSTLLVADMKDGLTPVLFQPTYLAKGRYAVILITAGNHAVGVYNKALHPATEIALQGTLFYSTDGDFFQGDIQKSVAIDLYFCQFAQATTIVQLRSLQLANGIAAIDINADSFVPPGCQMYFQIQIAGVWYSINESGTAASVFAGLPPLLPFRAVLVGNGSNQPCLGAGSNSRTRVWRPRADFKHISAIRTCPSSTTILVDIRLEAWRGSPHHTFVGKLLHGSGYTTVRPADVVSVAPAPDDPNNAVVYSLTFTGMGALTSFRLRLEGTTDNILTTFHVAERIDIETA